MRTTAMVIDRLPQAHPRYQISQAAALSGVMPANIRFYEKEKLFNPIWLGDNSY